MYDEIELTMFRRFGWFFHQKISLFITTQVGNKDLVEKLIKNYRRQNCNFSLVSRQNENTSKQKPMMDFFSPEMCQNLAAINQINTYLIVTDVKTFPRKSSLFNFHEQDFSIIVLHNVTSFLISQSNLLQSHPIISFVKIRNPKMLFGTPSTPRLESATLQI